jgi:hypothetical protein
MSQQDYCVRVVNDPKTLTSMMKIPSYSTRLDSTDYSTIINNYGVYQVHYSSSTRLVFLFTVVLMMMLMIRYQH